MSDRTAELRIAADAVSTAESSPATPPTFRRALREKMPSRCWGDFDQLCAWEDGILERLTESSETADRYREVLDALLADALTLMDQHASEEVKSEARHRIIERFGAST